MQPGIAPGVSDAAARPERTRRQSDEAPSPASVGSWEWPHVFALQLAGLEGRSTLLAAAGVRARAFHRQGGEFAFVFVQDAPADRGGSRAGEGGGEGEGADAGEVGDGRSDGGDSAASVEQRAKLVLVEALMRELVQDLARALHRDLPLELLLPPGIIDIEARAATPPRARARGGKWHAWRGRTRGAMLSCRARNGSMALVRSSARHALTRAGCPPPGQCAATAIARSPSAARSRGGCPETACVPEPCTTPC